MGYTRLIIEAGIYLALAAAVSAATCLLLTRLTSRAFVGSLPITITIATIASWLITEVWTQTAHLPRYAAPTIAVCIAASALATVIQSRSSRAGVEFRA